MFVDFEKQINVYKTTLFTFSIKDSVDSFLLFIEHSAVKYKMFLTPSGFWLI